MLRAFQGSLVLFCLMWFQSGCSDEPLSGHEEENDVGDSTEVEESDPTDLTDALDDVGDTGLVGDLPLDSADDFSDPQSPGTLEVGELCGSNSECQSNLCLFFEAGAEEGVCSKLCFEDSQCPRNFECTYVFNSGVEYMQVCVPEGLCIDEDQDGFGFGPGCLGPDCDDDDSLVNPGMPEICDGIDNNCSGYIDDYPVDANQPCDTGSAGVCSAGLTYCDTNTGSLSCLPRFFPGEELCDGLDNSCDGYTDVVENAEGELVALTESCYTGQPDTVGVGVCLSGQRVCMGGHFTHCLDQILPSPEICDNLDNDCNGLTDDGNPGGGVACPTDHDGVCARGETACVGGDIICVPTAMPGELEELCDGLDNSCDGFTDLVEDEDGEMVPLNRDCYYGAPETLDELGEPMGICLAGIETCEEGSFHQCVGQVLPRTEVCNALDDDCNGLIDDNPVDVGMSCTTGYPGICNAGVIGCVLGAEPPRRCVALVSPGEEEEVCDGQDNSCDGNTDLVWDETSETWEAVTSECYHGGAETLDSDGVPMGVCRAGMQTCDDGRYGSCVDQVLPTPEICDNLDNDCDGVIDNAPLGVGVVCPTGLDGVCAAGRTSCSGPPESPLVCAPLYQPLELEEVCNNLDDNCDGTIDLDSLGEPLRRTFYNGGLETIGPEGEPMGNCQRGVDICDSGAYQRLIDQILPSLEVCDGQDNSCDGYIDGFDMDGNLMGNIPIEVGTVCDTGFDGICEYGLYSCDPDSDPRLVCVPQYSPGDLPEICNDLDDNCDGTIDRDDAGNLLSRSFYEGGEETIGLDGEPMGLCQRGFEQCASGVYQRIQEQVLPAAEQCDGQDNSCDGNTDGLDSEGNWVYDPIGVGEPCPVPERAGICAEGLTQCLTGSIYCVQRFEARSESCNGLDDDCDGWIDNAETSTAHNTLTQSCYTGPADTRGVGQCRDGVRTCDFGEWSPCQHEVLPDDEEVCDGVDNTCNGDIDGGFEGLGEVCSVGLGVCYRVGIMSCNQFYDPDDPESEAVICNAEVVVPDYPEYPDDVCNYLDNNCDGYVDTGFLNAGYYDTLEHCGACGVNCYNVWDGTPEAFNLEPICAFEDEIRFCDYECLDGYYDRDEVPNNGCEFRPNYEAVYVSTRGNGGADELGCGNWEFPCASIQYAIDLAEADNGLLYVIVSDGVFRESIDLVDGVRVLGGHNHLNWVRNPEIYNSIISGRADQIDNAAVTASSISSSATELSGFIILAPNGGFGLNREGGNSIGVHVINSNQHLLIDDNIIFGGSGGSGSIGHDGTVGLSGLSGLGGQNAADGGDCDSQSRVGGGGGGSPCDRTGGAGGASLCPACGEGVFPGDGECPMEAPPHHNQQLAGGDGHEAVDEWGRGGDGAWNMLGWSPSTGGRRCNAGVGKVMYPFAGTPGRAGTDGSGGVGATEIFGELVGSQWRGVAGSIGAEGIHGNGGGGGGAAAGVIVNESTRCFGASGGGGGGGGCLGTGGAGGLPGGGSLGILLVWTDAAPTSVENMPVVSSNLIHRGYGGSGGSGGSGGAGGEGGPGGSGGAKLNDWPNFAYCLFDAADGGYGGRGGHGGGGGGGAGGVSYDIMVGGSSVVNPAYQEDNRFELDATYNTGGLGGLGGESSHVPDGLGGDGDDGDSGTTYWIP